MELDVLCRSQIETRYAVIGSFDRMKYSPLEDSYAPKYEVSLGGIFDMSGIVDVENMHWVPAQKKYAAE